MTNITDQQRREVAARLRDRTMTEGCEDPKRMRGILRTTRLESELFWIKTCMLPAFSRTETMGFEPMLDGLADLIDRPTCRAVLCHGGMYGCTRCGYDGWGDAESVTRYCPECGAEVERNA
jgi:predicted RNA-binding Zn-ribbon protein involved in translation (DUF1610 family)